MEFNSRIKIKLTDDRCIIQPEKNTPDTVTNSISLNISKSEDEDLLNENIEISMQSIFLSEKKRNFEGNNIGRASLKSLPETPTLKVENNKLLLNQLCLLPYSTNSTLSSTKNSGVNSIKNTTISLKNINTNNSNTTTSPFTSIGNTYSNNHSISSSFAEKKTGNDINRETIKKKRASENKKSFIDNFINKIVKQRNLSSRISRPSLAILQSSGSHQSLKTNQRLFHMHNNKDNKSNKIKSVNNGNINNEVKKKSNFSPSPLTLTKKINNSNSANAPPQGNMFSFVNFILGSRFTKNQINQVNKNNSVNANNSSRNRITLPFNKKIRSNPSDLQSGGMKLMITTKIEQENKRKQIQTISNFSNYIKKSKENNSKTNINSNNNVQMNSNRKMSLNVSRPVTNKTNFTNSNHNKFKRK